MWAKLKYFLLPISMLKALSLLWSRRMFNQKIWKSVAFDIPILSIHTLTKNPVPMHVIEAIRTVLLDHGMKSACMLDRKHTKRMKIEEKHDFSYLMKSKDKEMPCFYSNHTLLGVSELVHHYTEINCVILGDQKFNSEVRAQVKMLAVDYKSPFYDEVMWPVGRLTQLKSSAKEADMILVYNLPEKEDLELSKSTIETYVGKVVPVIGLIENYQVNAAQKTSVQIVFPKEGDTFENSLLALLK